MVPAPPARFSTITCWPSASPSAGATARAVMSTLPLGGQGTTMRTALFGKSCAWAANQQNARNQGRSFMLQYFMANPLDLRAWLDEIRKLGELRDVRGADSNLELGAISELNVKKDAPPALLFDEIAGYPKGFRVLTCSTSSPLRLSSILRLPLQKAHKGLVEALRGKPAQWQAAAKDFAFAVATSGPVLENVRKDATVDVLV